MQFLFCVPAVKTGAVALFLLPATAGGAFVLYGGDAERRLEEEALEPDLLQ